MTIDELEKTLPSGFHDASLNKLEIDFMKREAIFDMLLDVGDPESTEKNLREVKREGRLVITGLQYCVIEPPDFRYAYQKGGRLWIADSGPVKSSKVSAKVPEILPKGIFAHYFFINEWNAFIIVAAMDASLEWR